APRDVRRELADDQGHRDRRERGAAEAPAPGELGLDDGGPRAGRGGDLQARAARPRGAEGPARPRARHARRAARRRPLRAPAPRPRLAAGGALRGRLQDRRGRHGAAAPRLARGEAVRRALALLAALALSAGAALADEKTTAVVLDRGGTVEHGDPRGDGRIALAFALALTARPGARVAVFASSLDAPIVGEALGLEGLASALTTITEPPAP